MTVGVWVVLRTMIRGGAQTAAENTGETEAVKDVNQHRVQGGAA